MLKPLKPLMAGDYRKLPLRVRIALGLRIAELAAALQTPGYHKHMGYDVTLPVVRRYVASGKQPTAARVKRFEGEFSPKFDEYGEVRYRGEHYSFYEAAMVLSLLQEITTADGKSVACAIDGAAFTFGHAMLRSAGLQSRQVPTEVDDALQEPVFAATRAGLALGRTIAEEDVSLTTFASIVLAESTIDLSPYRARRKKRR